MNLAEMTVIESIGPVCAAPTTTSRRADDKATGDRRQATGYGLSTYSALSLAMDFIKATEVSYSVFNKAGDATCKWLTENLRFPRLLTNSPLSLVLTCWRVDGGKALILDVLFITSILFKTHLYNNFARLLSLQTIIKMLKRKRTLRFCEA